MMILMMPRWREGISLRLEHQRSGGMRRERITLLACEERTFLSATVVGVWKRTYLVLFFSIKFANNRNNLILRRFHGTRTSTDQPERVLRRSQRCNLARTMRWIEYQQCQATCLLFDSNYRSRVSLVLKIERWCVRSRLFKIP